jgi:dTDP-glucose 4,6-dehydratase
LYIHFHHISTDEVYGSLGEEGKFSERSAYRPNSPYAASKAASDHWVRAYSNTYNLSTTLSHCSNNYGPRQYPEKLIPLLLMNALQKKTIPIYGRGSQIRDWLYVDDHIDAIWEILKKGVSGQVYDIGGDSELKNLDLAHLLIELLAQELQKDPKEFKSLIRFVKDRPGHDYRYAIDSSKMQVELGWRPSVDLQTGLKKTIRWYLKHMKWISNLKKKAQLSG